jgi:hypothetical protein
VPLIAGMWLLEERVSTTLAPAADCVTAPVVAAASNNFAEIFKVEEVTAGSEFHACVSRQKCPVVLYAELLYEVFIVFTADNLKVRDDLTGTFGITANDPGWPILDSGQAGVLSHCLVSFGLV